jgi:hypothetical protein
MRIFDYNNSSPKYSFVPSVIFEFTESEDDKKQKIIVPLIKDFYKYDSD